MMKEQKKRGRPNQKERQINPELIVYIAKSLMREQGKVPSIRGLARALDIDAMAIYHYFDNKQRLLEAMLMSLMDSLYFPPKQQNWQDSLRLLSESYLNLLCHYAGLLEVLVAMPAQGPQMVFSERFNKIIAPLHLPAEKQKSMLLLLLNALHGQALCLKVTPEVDFNQQEFNETFTLYCTLIK
ncbi:TetR/AcrR family transcriptional regulator [Psychromonas sp. Urea-02u-13]|uniref:TetR/AcrR family transcriptional regulator n=1 Tax=Psychromonas sp. Urea-02u-13 TaxID=2058326 RepID=UPI000C344332|nr:TetR/AcrR family transcriptional regulator [Psychromonas sp. Urea-02u-13]PKG39160.1 TetR family transcriptional regulator [Psychromonas sp. Urea-02u-13]